MHRKGNVHDLAFTNGRGPRLHHLAYWVPTPLQIIHLCDLMATTGDLANLERGPGRHGISNAFFLYVHCPDGHHLEVYSCDIRPSIPIMNRSGGTCATSPADAVGSAGAALLV